MPLGVSFPIHRTQVILKGPPYMIVYDFVDRDKGSSKRAHSGSAPPPRGGGGGKPVKSTVTLGKSLSQGPENLSFSLCCSSAVTPPPWTTVSADAFQHLRILEDLSEGPNLHIEQETQPHLSVSPLRRLKQLRKALILSSWNYPSLSRQINGAEQKMVLHLNGARQAEVYKI